MVLGYYIDDMVAQKPMYLSEGPVSAGDTISTESARISPAVNSLDSDNEH